MDIIETFRTVRDMPYRIRLGLDEQDMSCSAKHRLLKDLFTKQGFETRYRVCTFLWSSLNLPKAVLSIPHDDLSSHVWLEVSIDGERKIVDATWDTGLRNVLPVNEWDGVSNMQTAVKPIEILSPERSVEIMSGENDAEVLSDLEVNGAFYRALNRWLEEERKCIS